ncbi:MAG: MFS transporter [bacterium]|nr:MFS transporter [bacterium]
MWAVSATVRKLGILWALYFVQGLPFGFQATALPVYLREAGLSLTAIGFATALSLPWMLKAFWAPLVDRFGSKSFGRRRSWILPLEVVLASLCIFAAFLDPGSDLKTLLALVFLMNLAAATMDIAVDGLAIDLLTLPELGKGNIAQVVGYKIGMLTGGGLLVWASGKIGWQGLFLSMAGLVFLVAIVTSAYRERDLSDPHVPTSPLEHPTMSAVLRLLKESFATRGTAWLIIFIGTYKLGENMADTMFKPFLVDAGFAREQIGLWVGTWGMLFSILGSVAGGLLASRIRMLHAVGLAAAFRVLPVIGEWWLTVVEPTSERVLAVTCAEHFFGGALTTALFAYMMARVDKRIGATHYTLLASVEVWGKVPAAWVSGAITQATSYTFIFGLAAVLSLLFLSLLAPVGKHEPERLKTRSSQP